MPVISEEGKRKRNRGKGHGAMYKPWILAREINSLGTTANIVDWKHGRTTQLLSQGEEWWYYFLRWDDDVADIREQFPLFEPEDTVRIADQYGFRHPGSRTTTMTTDLFVDYTDGSQAAYSVKSSRADVDYTLAKNEDEARRAIRTAEKLMIEKTYWTNKGVSWKLLYKEDLDRQYIHNIRRVVVYYDRSKVHDDASMIKHLIATKQISIDMHAPLDYLELIREYLPRKEEQWKNLH